MTKICGVNTAVTADMKTNCKTKQFDVERKTELPSVLGLRRSVIEYGR